MDKARIIREIMVSGKSYTTKEVANIIKESYPNEWEEKEKYYLLGGKDEEYVFRQVRAEVGCTFAQTRGGWIKNERVTREKNEEGSWVYTITPEYQQFLKTNNVISSHFLDTDESNFELEIIEDEKIVDDCEECPKDYYVYLMKSDEFDNTYKIGYTDSLERRPKELRSPSNKVYNIFNFYVKYWVKLSSKLEMELMEDTLHRYFHRNRKYPKNGNTVLTEIFVNSNLEYLFSDFVLINYINNDYHKNVVLDSKLQDK
jgi:hypothetical protein